MCPVPEPAPAGSTAEASAEAAPAPEAARLADPAWRRWGPFLSERAWGTVREDYSPDGEAWRSFPHDHARSRAYRWSEDGLGGICDERQRLCFAFSFWNGADPFLKERIFGLNGEQGNHGEDAKEYWWYLDSTPSHSWMRWRYVYPQRAFPYQDLIDANARRGREQPEYELLDTGVFAEDRYWEITADYAKAGPDDLRIRLSIVNRGPEPASLHVLPTLWFRNRWSWQPGAVAPAIRRDGDALVTGAEDGLDAYRLSASLPPVGSATPTGDRADPGAGAVTRPGVVTPLFCDNETNATALWGNPESPAYPKDGIADHVVSGGAAGTVNPAERGSKAALWVTLTIPAGETAELALVLCAEGAEVATDSSAVWEERRREADDFYRQLAPTADADRARVLRQACAGMLWSKQFYHYDVGRWLDGDPGQPPPPPERHQGRNAHWRHLSNHDVISMPDKWEYPWYAAWDLAFHTIVLAHLDPGFAKEQLRLLTREWYAHPAGKLPAYEWNFDDVNPPVHAIAALAVYRRDGSRDPTWLARIFHKLLLNFSWWANAKDPEERNLFGGGFLGMDNVGPFDRSTPLPDGLVLEQADGTGWMAIYCLSMLEIALVLAHHDRAYEDVAITFFEHFTLIAEAINAHGLWDETDGFYYDRVRRPADGTVWPVRVASMTGLIPLCAVATAEHTDGLNEFNRRVGDYLRLHPEARDYVRPAVDGRPMLMALVGPEKLTAILSRALDPDEFLSPHGLRALSARYRDRPYAFFIDGELTASVDYEPAESTTPLFGGNSNWRGPVWFPVNYLVLGALARFAAADPAGAVRCPAPGQAGGQLTLAEVVSDLSERLVSIFCADADGQRPVFGAAAGMPAEWQENLLFHEYFHGDTGAGLGASHQTGWTGLVADLIIGGLQGTETK
ncbi:hypothetical protein [Conexibacter sp. DBS9H8]|uniref:MGH1-like glycoside hydrolase domain-containing protein n=1 Tax=Conexibacter sp. DBS9H8 TaxID=2937801 RepID=UPI00200E7FC9|nr:hypothetical protein [Conexibacter sp. DBS9H8]